MVPHSNPPPPPMSVRRAPGSPSKISSGWKISKVMLFCYVVFLEGDIVRMILAGGGREGYCPDDISGGILSG